jgi:hypothetical protein
MTEERKYTLKELEDIKALTLKHNPAAGAPTYAGVHSGTGMFTEPGVHPDMYSALVGPRTFMDALPFVKSEWNNELISILTGQLAGTGTNPTDTCGTPPKPGQLKKCTRTLTFGKLFLGTEKLAVDDIGLLKNRADLERQINNMARSGNPMIPEILRAPGLNFRSAKAHQLFMLSNEVQRAVASVEVQGNATLANTATNRGWISEFDGLDRLIKTGHVDVSTSIACPAADSHVITWGQLIDGTLEGLNIVSTMNDMYQSRQWLAMDVGMDGTQWAWVMDKRLFHALTYVYACNFPFARCNFSAATPGGHTQAEIETRAMEMQRGQYLLMLGQPVPVLFTPGTEVAIPDKSSNGLTADAYLVPMSWNATDLTWMEYFPLDNTFISEWEGIANQGRVTHNNGMYMTAIRSDGFCDELLLTGRFRMIMRTPFLAARLDNITFNALKGYRDFEPGGTFHYDGGVTQYGA